MKTKYEFQKIVGSPVQKKIKILRLIAIAKKEIAEWQEFLRVAKLEYDNLE